MTDHSRIPINWSIKICKFIPQTATRPCLFQNCKMPMLSSIGACKFGIPGAFMSPGPFQKVEMAILGSIGAYVGIPRTFMSLTHINSRWPFKAAQRDIYSSHGHWYALAHFSNSRWPFKAALEHVISFHGHWLALAHYNNSRWPCLAAFEHVSLFHEIPSILRYCTTSRYPLNVAIAIISSFKVPLRS